MRIVPFTGTITGRNVGVLFANSSYILTNGDYTGNITVENLTVDGSINALGGNSGVSFSNSKTELSGVSEEAKACVNNIAADATLAIDGANDAEYTVTAATNADVSYYEIQLSLATVYWYEDDTYTRALVRADQLQQRDHPRRGRRSCRYGRV